MNKRLNIYEPYELKNVGSRIWQSDGSFIKFYGISFPIRMFLIQLESNDFAVVSPIQLDIQLVNAIKFTMGIRKLLYIISGTSLHNKFLEDWVNEFPGVELAGTQELVDKMKKEKRNLRFRYILNNNLKVPWQNEIDHILIEGNRWVEEAIFFHKSSKSVIVSDIIQNHDLSLEQYSNRLLYKLVGIDSDKGGGCPKDYRMGFKWPFGDIEKAKNTLRQGLYWDFNKILLMHGLHILDDAKEYYIDFIKSL